MSDVRLVYRTYKALFHNSSQENTSKWMRDLDSHVTRVCEGQQGLASLVPWEMQLYKCNEKQLHTDQKS